MWPNTRLCNGRSGNLLEPSESTHMKPMSVFYHIWSPAGTDLWQFIVDEQLKRLYRHGIHAHADIYCAISGPLAFASISNLSTLYRTQVSLTHSINPQC